MSINIPGLPRAVNAILLQMANADLIPYDAVTNRILPHNEMDDEAINEFFEQGGFESTQSVVNLGSSFVYQVISVPLIMFTLIIAQIPKP